MDNLKSFGKIPAEVMKMAMEAPYGEADRILAPYLAAMKKTRTGYRTKWNKTARKKRK